MRTLRVVDDEVVIQILLHLFHGFVPLGASLDAEMFVQQRSVKPLDEAIALRPSHLGRAVLDLFELEEQLIWVMIFAAAEFSAVVAQHRADPGIVRLEEGQHVVVEHMNGRDGQLVGVQAPPGVAAEAVDDGLQVDLADAFECADEEGIDGHQLTGVVYLYMALAELRTEALQMAHLVIGQFDLLLACGLLEAKETLMAREQVMASPDASDARRADLNPA